MAGEWGIVYINPMRQIGFTLLLFLGLPALLFADFYDSSLEDPIYYAHWNEEQGEFTQSLSDPDLDTLPELYLVQLNDGVPYRAEHYLRDFITHVFQRTRLMEFDETGTLLKETVYVTGLGQTLGPYTLMKRYYDAGLVQRKEYYNFDELDGYVTYSYDTYNRLLTEAVFQKRLGQLKPSRISTVEYFYNPDDTTDLKETMSYYGDLNNLLSRRIRYYEHFDPIEPAVPSRLDRWLYPNRNVVNPLPPTVPILAPPLVTITLNHQHYRLTRQALINHLDQLVVEIQVRYNDSGLKQWEGYSQNGKDIYRYYEFDYDSTGILTEYRHFTGEGRLESRFVRNRHGVWVLFGETDTESILY
jgi:hypothetical protein